jgi:hypothetical protein
MATKWYFLDDLFADLSDYPQTNQHPSLTPTSGKALDAFDVTRQFSTSIGDALIVKQITSNATTSQQTFYFGRWMTPRLNLGGGIDANTWTVVLAGFLENSAGNYPVSGANQSVQIFCYVWRDGVGLVGTIRQGTSVADWDELPQGQNETFGGTFSGSAVGSLQDGDRIVYEMWYQISQSSSTAIDDYFYFNGPVEAPLPYGSTVEGGGSSNSGSYISTPQNITAWTPPENITMSITSKNMNNKFITTVV